MAAKKERELLKEHLYWAYANLAMAHSAVDKGQEDYGMFNFMIRAKLYKGLLSGTMNIRTLFDDEKIKLANGLKCSYCEATEKLALDHILPKIIGGRDEGDNLIFACKSCNSSKGKKDLMEWMQFRGDFLPLFIIRRYLKLAISHCIENELTEKKLNELDYSTIPYKIKLIPINYPKPSQLKLI